MASKGFDAVVNTITLAMDEIYNTTCDIHPELSDGDHNSNYGIVEGSKNMSELKENFYNYMDEFFEQNSFGE